MKIFYWSPHIAKVATVTSVINSIKSFKYYSKKNISIGIIECFNEWEENKVLFKDLNIQRFKLQDNTNIKNMQGFFKSRFIYIKTFLSVYFNLKKVLKKEEPNFLIVHLITFIPLILFLFNNFNTCLILRISGMPKLNIFRKLLWKICSKKIKIIFCPTIETLKNLEEKNIFSKDKLFLLRDPVIEISKINKLKKKEFTKILPFSKKNYYISIGRLTYQKNQIFLIKQFKNNFPNENLLIVGEGELKEKLNYEINQNKIKNVRIIEFQENIYNFLNYSKGLIMSSRWEDPGFVMVEAASLNVPVLISDCPSGPKEFIENNLCGFLYVSEDTSSFKKNFNLLISSEEYDLFQKKINAKKKARFYSLFKHNCEIEKYLFYNRVS